ncbi:hypothetical protein [Staphylococcus kloosii]|uniref:Phage protein n=1 Tax=Staphylococcus kloosii TaxID=29384 RepID=A0ABQ0XN92_9STAP|nr:hypothetical protein [Staphylococcus kloosii]AVQ36610.1 hypothetical protein C7J89_10755 [Staphylococcus kloosii]PNZ03962.1 hypothetical protein CD136_09855 [Staphylococcus kloosii]GEP81434.1 hypothetical protein SKL01_06120 [Staphylococcus kloosii]SUM49701.1 hypothetical phage-related protein [Staphylococcus kloosii]
MTIIQLQQLLGHLYRDTYKGNTAIQLCILELGYAVQRLLENELITPYDDYEANKQIIFDEYRGVII